jgi:hypothetical protein
MFKFWEGERITELPANGMFVFGSNVQGVHGAGAARQALGFGAVMGVGEGVTGDCYALPTVDFSRRSRPSRTLDEVREAWVRFVVAACGGWPDKTFYITAFGTGLAGFTAEQMAGMVKANPPLSENVLFPPEWKELLDD